MLIVMTSKLLNKTILVVDDEVELQKIIAQVLVKNECKVLTAFSGNEALKVIEETDIDIVISDVKMPDGSGFELLAELRKKDQKKPIVLLMSGDCDLDNSAVIKLGALALMQKPLSKKKLLATIEAAL